MRNTLLGTAVLLCLVSLPVQAATVDWVSGEVTYSRRQGDWRNLEVGTDLVAGDMVQTGWGAEAVLLEDGGRIHIMENSRFTVSEKYEQEEKRSAFMLFLGRLRFKLGKGGEKEPEFQTQTVNLTIRGTEFEVGSGYDGSTLVLLEEGNVVVRGRTRELVLDEGEGTEVPFGEEPEEKFRLITRVIDWGQWFARTRDAVEGNEELLLARILDRFTELQAQIREQEHLREEALAEKERLIQERDRLLARGEDEEASRVSREAGGKSKLAFHARVNVRFLALSSIGLFDMAQRIYAGIPRPTAEVDETYAGITRVYIWIEERYILEGDRERLERQAEKKRGCSSLF
ncbi:MAG: FecR domain-containing protein [Spirochaetota bacterium]